MATANGNDPIYSNNRNRERESKIAVRYSGIQSNNSDIKEP